MNKTEETQFDKIVYILLSDPNFCTRSAVEDIEYAIQIARKESPILFKIPFIDGKIEKAKQQHIKILTELKATEKFKRECVNINKDKLLGYIKDAIFLGKMPNSNSAIKNRENAVSRARSKMGHLGMFGMQPRSVPGAGGGKIRHHRHTHRKHHTSRRNRRISRCKRY
jgi:hypothetical protein